MEESHFNLTHLPLHRKIDLLFFDPQFEIVGSFCLDEDISPLLGIPFGLVVEVGVCPHVVNSLGCA